MKKTMFIAAAGLVLIFSSCSSKKDWTCTCTLSSSLAAANQAFPLVQLTEDEVKAQCNSKVQTGNSSGSCTYAAK